MSTRRIKRPTVALVGRTNVGKSTLWNRLLEEERAIVSDVPGTTRDRNYGLTRWRGVEIQVVDTGGLDVGRAEELERDVVKQAETAMKEADLVLFVVDMATGPLPQDRTLAAALANTKKPVILVGNKADNPRIRNTAYDPAWSKLRIGEVHPVSAKNGTGIGDMLDIVLERLGLQKEDLRTVETSIAIIGRPNVGKSSIVNRLCREDRQIVSPIPGTTREPQDTLIEAEGHRFLLIDTVGLRRRSRSTPKLEAQGVDRTKLMIERAEVLLLVVDAAGRISSQDRTLAGMAEDSGKATVLVANKWDLVPEKTAKSLNENQRLLRREFPFFKFAPIMFVSAKAGTRVDDLLHAAREAKLRWQKEIPEKQLDSFFRRTIAGSKGPGHPYIYKMKQTGAEPPTFALWVRSKEPVPEAFLRFVENRLREKFDFVGTPIRVRGKNIRVKPQ